MRKYVLILKTPQNYHTSLCTPHYSLMNAQKNRDLSKYRTCYCFIYRISNIWIAFLGTENAQISAVIVMYYVQ